jgi:hypothetical protein
MHIGGRQIAKEQAQVINGENYQPKLDTWMEGLSHPW